MGRKRKQLLAVAAAAAMGLSLAACGGSKDGQNTVAPPVQSTGVTTGGTLDYLVNGTIDHLDPQRIYTGRDIANFGRTLFRSLLAFPANASTTALATTPVPDLATNLGTSSDGAKVWSFTLKDGVTWQDGSAITCADLKYGVSRTFATDVITGGPNYILGYLDVPHDPKTDAPLYDGPYKKDGQAAFDKAVTCSSDNKTITYHFRKPWPDFPLAIASLPAFDPYKASMDKGPKSDFTPFSDGPYELQGKWDQDKGGVLVRNPNYDASTDTIRKAYPNEIDFKLGYDPAAETLIKTLIADKDPDAIAASSVPPDLFPKISGSVAQRAVNIESPFTNYLVPNFTRLTNLKVREALAEATNRQAYSQALGGSKVSTPAQSIVNPSVPGYVANPAYSTTGAPDIAKAKADLAAAGVSLPYPITLTYPLGSDSSNNAFAALKQSYDAAGFKTTLDGLDPSTAYYPAIQNPGSTSDLIWGGWGADWPSINTVIPPLFDSRVNLTSSSSNGEDYGNFASTKINKEFDTASSETDLTKSNSDWSAIDKELSAEVAYIPLDTTKFYFLRGSNVENYSNTAATSQYPDLAVVALTDPTK